MDEYRIRKNRVQISDAQGILGMLVDEPLAPAQTLIQRKENDKPPPVGFGNMCLIFEMVDSRIVVVQLEYL